MIEDLHLLQGEGQKVDLAICSGDIVLAGENREHFSLAYEEIIRPILAACEVGYNDIIFCPGNHDISRQSVRESGFMEVGLSSTLNSVDKVNGIIDKISDDDPIALHAISRMKNYDDFIAHLQQDINSKHPMVSTYVREVRGITVGIASFNNAWRASGESGSVDRHRLILGERAIDLAMQSLPKLDLRLAMFHHPLDWLTDFDLASVSPRLQRSFDLLAFGHVHDVEPVMKLTSAGTAVLSQSGAMFAGRNYFNGFQIIDVDPKVATVEIKARMFYPQPVGRFGSAEKIAHQGVFSTSYLSPENKSSVELEKYLRDAREHVREAALNQFNIADLGEDICSDPHTAFICPPLYREKTTRQPDLTEAETASTPVSASRSDQMELSDILQSSSNFIIEGSRETGKTSLAHFLAVKVAEGTVDRPRLPVVIDYRTIRLNKYGLITSLSSYLKIPKSGYDVEGGMTRGELVFILDNFGFDDVSRLRALMDSANLFPNCRWIALTDAVVGGTKQSPELAEDLKFEKVYLRTLPRHSIRELTARWCNRTGADREETYGTVMAQIRDGDLPRTGYIVTLLLWALKQNKSMERINESVLLMNVLDYLLGKADFTKAIDSEFDATAKEFILQEFAWHLKKHNGSILINDATEFFISFFRSKGLGYDAASVVRSFCKCGILQEFDGSIAFKYRCFQDYFSAKRISSSERILKSVVYNREYLHFSRELDLASGLMRVNDIIVDELIFQIAKYRPSDLRNYIDADFDNIVESASAIGVTRRQLAKIRKSRLSARQIDDLMDNAEAAVAKKKPAASDKDTKTKNGAVENIDATNQSDTFAEQSETNLKLYDSPLSPLDYMQSIDLLGRVLRNSEFLDKGKKLEGISAFINSNSAVFFKLNEAIGTVIDGFVADVQASGEIIEPATQIAFKHFLSARVMMVIADRNKEAIQSHKLVPMFDQLLASKSLTLADRMFLTALQLDSGNPRWDEWWKSHVKSSTKKRLVTQFLSDRLWSHIHDRVQSDQSQQKVVSVATELEIELSDFNVNPKRQRGIIGLSVKKAVSDVFKKGDDV